MARAINNRCRWPPERLEPLSPASVYIPIGIALISSTIPAYRSADVSAAVTFEFLPSNHLRQGKLDEAVAQVRRETSRVVEAERQVRVGVRTFWPALEAAAGRCRQARGAVRQFEAALAGEREKYRLGVGSIVDLLTVEDRLTAASAAAVEAEGNFAATLARLVLVTGAAMQDGVGTADPFTGAGALGKRPG